MNKEIKEFCNKVWNEEARKQLEAELNFMSKEKIELPKGKDYLELFAKTHKTDEEIIEEKDKEIERLNNIINKLEEHLITMSKIYEEEYKDIDTSEDYKSMLDKLKELKGRKK